MSLRTTVKLRNLSAGCIISKKFQQITYENKKPYLIVNKLNEVIYLSLTVQSLLCQYNNRDIKNILNIVYLDKIFNMKNDVDLWPLKT